MAGWTSAAAEKAVPGWEVRETICGVGVVVVVSFIYPSIHPSHRHNQKKNSIRGEDRDVSSKIWKKRKEDTLSPSHPSTCPDSPTS